MTELWAYFSENVAQIASWTMTTVWLALVPLAVGAVLSVPVGWLAHRSRWIARPLIPAARILYTVPSLVMFLVLPDILGTRILDPLNVGVALTVYTMALLIPTVSTAFASVPSDALTAASAMGQSQWQRFWALQLPLSLPVFGAGLRVAAVSNVALISVASIIGTAQLGQLFVTGTNLSNVTPIILGLVLFIALALVLDLAVIAGTKAATPWLRRVSS